MFEKRLVGAVLALVAMFTISESALAQKFPPVDLLPAEFQKEATLAELTYQELLTAKEESDKAFESLGQAIKKGKPSSVLGAYLYYKAKATRHFGYWIKTLGHMENCADLAAQMIVYDDPSSSKQEIEAGFKAFIQFETWYEFAAKSWTEAALLGAEREKVLQKARELAYRSFIPK